jgi:hypothetical protein
MSDKKHPKRSTPKPRPLGKVVVTAHPYPQIPMALELPEITPRHLVIGDHNHQVECLAHLVRQALGSVEVIDVEILSDQDVLNSVDPTIWVIPTLRDGSLAQGTLAGLHKWVSAPLTKGSAGVNSIVRVAAKNLGVRKPLKAIVDFVGSAALEDSDGDNLDAILWGAQWLLTDPMVEAKSGEDRVHLTHPWMASWDWFNIKMPLEKRLHILYKDLMAWVYSQEDNAAQLRKLGVSPSKVKWLKELNLPAKRVHDTLMLLSVWRSRQGDPFRAAMEISYAWTK